MVRMALSQSIGRITICVAAMCCIAAVVSAFIYAPPPDVKDADDIGIPLPPPPPPPPQPTCIIEVCCHPIGATLGLAWHCYTKCTKTYHDGRKEITVCGGNPSGGILPPKKKKVDPPGTESPCPGWNFFDGPDGWIKTHCDPFESVPEWKRRDKARCRQVSSGDCAACDCIKDVFCRIEKCCIRYRLLEENSNSSAYTALKRCLTELAIQLPHGNPWAPGWGNEINLGNCPTCP